MTLWAYRSRAPREGLALAIALRQQQQRRMCPMDVGRAVADHAVGAPCEADWLTIDWLTRANAGGPVATEDPD